MRVLSILVIAAVVVLGLMVTRAAREQPSPAAPAPPPPLTAPPQKPQTADRSAVGTLVQVDIPALRIGVATPSGPLTLSLERTAAIRQGARTVKLVDLPAHRGERVKVRYREASGQPRADWVVLAAVPRKK